MKVAVTAEDSYLDVQVDPRFGRCRYFLICDTEKGSFEAIENSNAQFSGGAGIQSAQLMVSKGVEIVLTGNIGPNAFRVLETAGVRVITNITGPVATAIEKLKQNQVKSAPGPTVHSKFGDPRKLE